MLGIDVSLPVNQPNHQLGLDQLLQKKGYTPEQAEELTSILRDLPDNKQLIQKIIEITDAIVLKTKQENYLCHKDLIEIIKKRISPKRQIKSLGTIIDALANHYDRILYLGFSKESIIEIASLNTGGNKINTIIESCALLHSKISELPDTDIKLGLQKFFAPGKMSDIIYLKDKHGNLSLKRLDNIEKLADIINDLLLLKIPIDFIQKKVICTSHGKGFQILNSIGKNADTLKIFDANEITELTKVCTNINLLDGKSNSNNYFKKGIFNDLLEDIKQYSLTDNFDKKIIFEKGNGIKLLNQKSRRKLFGLVSKTQPNPDLENNSEVCVTHKKSLMQPAVPTTTYGPILGNNSTNPSLDNSNSTTSKTQSPKLVALANVGYSAQSAKYLLSILSEHEIDTLIIKTQSITKLKIPKQSGIFANDLLCIFTNKQRSGSLNRFDIIDFFIQHYVDFVNLGFVKQQIIDMACCKYRQEIFATVSKHYPPLKKKISELVQTNTYEVIKLTSFPVFNPLTDPTAYLDKIYRNKIIYFDETHRYGYVYDNGVRIDQLDFPPEVDLSDSSSIISYVSRITQIYLLTYHNKARLEKIFSHEQVAKTVCLHDGKCLKNLEQLDSCILTFFKLNMPVDFIEYVFNHINGSAIFSAIASLENFTILKALCFNPSEIEDLVNICIITNKSKSCFKPEVFKALLKDIKSLNCDISLRQKLIIDLKNSNERSKLADKPSREILITSILNQNNPDNNHKLEESTSKVRKISECLNLNSHETKKPSCSQQQKDINTKNNVNNIDSYAIHNAPTSKGYGKENYLNTDMTGQGGYMVHSNNSALEENSPVSVHHLSDNSNSMFSPKRKRKRERERERNNNQRTDHDHHKKRKTIETTNHQPSYEPNNISESVATANLNEDSSFTLGDISLDFDFDFDFDNKLEEIYGI